MDYEKQLNLIIVEYCSGCSVKTVMFGGVIKAYISIAKVIFLAFISAKLLVMLL